MPEFDDDVTLSKPEDAEASSLAGGQDETLDTSTAPARQPTREQLLAMLDVLPEDQRQAVRLRHFQRLPLDVIGNNLGCSTADVVGLLRRAMHTLRGRIVDSP